MFDNLVASKPKRPKTAGETVVSVLLHAVIIFAAVKVTAAAPERIRAIIQDTTAFVLEQEEPEPEPEPPPPDAVVSANPPPKGFQTLVPPDAIPKDIPPINLNERFDPKNFTGRGTEGGVATGIVGGTGPVDLSNNEVFLEAQVDDPPQLLQPGPQRFPPVLQNAGITGRVEVQFIVDTEGHAEPASFKVLSSTHKAFEEPAREMILKSLFKPGRSRGQPVRVLVRQAINFTNPGA